MSRRHVLVYSILGVLLAGILAALLVIINQQNRAAYQQDQERKVAICERTVDDPYGDGIGDLAQCVADLTE